MKFGIPSLPLPVLQPPAAEQRSVGMVRRLCPVRLAPAGDLREVREDRPGRFEMLRRLAALAQAAGDFVAFAVPGLLAAPFAAEAGAPGIARFAAPAPAVGALAPQARFLLVKVEHLDRLRRAHR